MHKALNKIKLDKIISNDTVYSIVWGGKYENKRCVIKMIVISSGKTKEKYFKENAEKPFLHKEFKDKKALSPREFKHETEAYLKFEKLGMGPKIYDYGIHKDYDIHYGLIIMERLDCSIKQILMKRELTHKEHELVNNLIDKLHNKHEIVHGDMKPSNIGVYLNEKGEIKECYFFDCQKVKYKKDYDSGIFRQLVTHDNYVYRDHYINNRKLSHRKK
ncbi:hypothetical protein Klosneuvirus_6_75 [Klosneuvirus KNV1]|uniref:Protein kinase domain-containing protein n=1 Tax=Klosneuvirus KNV1 TaxID=1977640 RepID=A0A1V0SLC4_9VIRU|nr:hypothetical protein Klosneuvirus_6_75 [Klosneuvirus KNV1]